MNLVPRSVTRLVGRSTLKLSGASPTILVVAGVVGLGATAVMAARATRHIDPILEEHQKLRNDIENVNYVEKRSEQRALVELYGHTSWELGRLYGPTIIVGTLSAVSILGGHRILVGRHVATMAAYSGLLQEFRQYRGRVTETLGEEKELAIYNGGVYKYVEDPDHKGEFKQVLQKSSDEPASYLRPMFDEYNVNWTTSPEANFMFLKGVQQHMNNMLQIRGHVFLNDVFDDLRFERVPQGQVVGWRLNGEGDNYVDFGFMHDVPFRNHEERSVRLNFNVDGLIWEDI